MAKVTFNDVDATGTMELTPQGGTPFDKWFSCCFPKSSGPEPNESSPNVPGSVVVHDKGLPVLLPVTEETQSGILREYSDANIPNLQHDEGSPSEIDLDDDFDDVTPSSNKNVQISNSAVAEFWKMVFSIFFLSWMKHSQPKKIENGGKSTTTSTASSVDGDSVPVLCPSSPVDSDSVPDMFMTPAEK